MKSSISFSIILMSLIIVCPSYGLDGEGRQHKASHRKKTSDKHSYQHTNSIALDKITDTYSENIVTNLKKLPYIFNVNFTCGETYNSLELVSSSKFKQKIKIEIEGIITATASAGNEEEDDCILFWKKGIK